MSFGEPTYDRLKVAVRAYTPSEPTYDEPHEGKANQRKPRKSKPRSNDRPPLLLVLDTETRADGHSQALNFASYRAYRVAWSQDGPALTCIDDGLVYPDDLPERYPEGYETLRAYIRAHGTGAIDPVAGSALRMGLYRLSHFTENNGPLHRFVVDGRAMIVAFNYPFDMSRLAWGWGDGSNSFAGGFSLKIFGCTDADGQRHEAPWLPHARVRHLNPKAALKDFTLTRDTDPTNRLDEDGAPYKGGGFRGNLLDLRTLTFALTNTAHTLESACSKDAFNVLVNGEPYKKRDVEHGLITSVYIDYGREDVEATAGLFVETMREYVRHPIDLPVTEAYSPASIAKAYLKALGVRPPLERNPDFPPEVLGHSMVAYYGGWVESHIRRWPVPVVHTDFLSMYPTVWILLGIWGLLCASRIEVEEVDPAKVEAWIGSLSTDDLFNPEMWPKLAGLVELAPDGDVLPVRARYGGSSSFGIGINHYRSDPRWYALPDAVASAIRTGRAPRVLRAVRFVPVGRARTLKPTMLRGETPVDPRDRGANFFRTLIEERSKLSDRKGDHGQFLKVLANTGAFGIYGEMNRDDRARPKATTVTVHGLESFESDVQRPEAPGKYFFAPIACLVTAAARLMLGLLEVKVKMLGGTWAFNDTDSMAIVATEEGGLIPCPGGPHRTEDGQEAVYALRWHQVDEIDRSFKSLNPYDRTAVDKSILEIEDENYKLDPADPKGKRVTGERLQLHCYSISAKRYALYNLDEDGRPIMRKWSEHGLGHLLNPGDPDNPSRQWMREGWEYIVLKDAVGAEVAEPPWFDLITTSRIATSKPGLLHRFEQLNRGKPSYEQVRPFNFLLAAHVAPLGHPAGVDPARFQLIAPYESDPRKWSKLPWVNRYDEADQPTTYSIVTDMVDQVDGSIVVVKTYRGVFNLYRTNPEPKSLGPGGKPCDRQTRGLMRRRYVKADVDSTSTIGKEGNDIEEQLYGLVHDPDEVLTEYTSTNGQQTKLDPTVHKVLLTVPLSGVRAAAQVRGGGVSERTIKRARADRSVSRSNRLALSRVCLRHARRALRDAGLNPPSAHEATLGAYLDSLQRLCECGCGERLTNGQRRWHGEACRQRADRAAARSEGPDPAQPQPHLHGCDGR